MKKISVEIRPHILHIIFGDEFATMTLNPNKDNIYMILFSSPISTKDADVIDNSGIAEVQKINIDERLITFKKRNFYETNLMSDLIIDIIKRHEDE